MKTDDKPLILLAPKTVGERLGISASRVVQLAREGALPEIRDSNGRRLFRPEDVERLAAERAERRKSEVV